MGNPSRSISLLLLMTALGGCEQKFHPVSGIITLDGKPLEQASISFIPTGPGQPAVATTDSMGRYILETNNNVGALKGDFKIVVTKSVYTTYDERKRTGTKTSFPVPVKYSKLETSGLEISIPNTIPNSYDVKLISK